MCVLLERSLQYGGTNTFPHSGNTCSSECVFFSSTSEHARSSTKCVEGIFCVVVGSKHVVLMGYTVVFLFHSRLFLVSGKMKYKILTTGCNVKTGVMALDVP